MWNDFKADISYRSAFYGKIIDQFNKILTAQDGNLLNANSQSLLPMIHISCKQPLFSCDNEYIYRMGVPHHIIYLFEVTDGKMSPSSSKYRMAMILAWGGEGSTVVR
jgi:hypothetical protein